jgi:hypothetical protein
MSYAVCRRGEVGRQTAAIADALLRLRRRQSSAPTTIHIHLAARIVVLRLEMMRSIFRAAFVGDDLSGQGYVDGAGLKRCVPINARERSNSSAGSACRRARNTQRLDHGLAIGCRGIDACTTKAIQREASGKHGAARQPSFRT